MRVWSHRNSHSLLLGMQNGSATVEDELGSFLQTKHTFTIWSRNCTGFTNRSWKDLALFKNLHRTVYAASQMAQRVKRLPAMQETQVRSLGQEDSLEKGMATHYNILAWRIPQTQEPGGLQSTGSQRVGDNRATNTSIFTSFILVSSLLKSKENFHNEN